MLARRVDVRTGVSRFSGPFGPFPVNDEGALPMKKFLIAVGVFALAGNVLAAGKPCEELKSEIDAKLKAKGVASYSLEVVDKGSAGGKQVVGTCEGGTKEIVYSK